MQFGKKLILHQECETSYPALRFGCQKVPHSPIDALEGEEITVIVINY